MSTPPDTGMGPSTAPKAGSGVASGLLWVAIEKAIGFAVALGGSIVLARLIAPREFGIVGLANATFFLLARFGGIGANQEVIRLDPALPDYEERLNTLYVLHVVVCALLFLLCLAAMWVLPFFRTPLTRNVFLATAIGWTVHNMMAPSQAILQKTMRFRALSVVSWVTGLAGTIGSVVLALLGCGIWSLVLPPLAALLVRAAILAGLAGFVPRPTLLPAMCAIQLRRAPLYLRVGLLEEAYQRIDDLAVGWFAGAEALGQYRRAYTLGGLFHHNVGTVLTRVLFPVFARGGSQDLELRQTYARAGAASIYMVSAFVTLMGLYCREVVLLLYGDQWLPCVPIFRALAVYAVLFPLFELSREALTAMGYVGQTGRAYAAMCGSMVVLLFPCLSAWGAIGAAVAVDVALLLGLILILLEVRRRLGVDIAQSFGRPLLLSLCGAAVLVVLWLWLAPRGLVVQGAASGAAFSIMAAAIALGPERELTAVALRTLRDLLGRRRCLERGRR